MNKNVIICNCQGKIIEPHLLASIDTFLEEQSVSFTKFIDICSLCVTSKNEIKQLFSENAEYLVIACHSRAVKLLLGNVGIENFDAIKILNCRDIESNSLYSEIKNFVEDKSVVFEIKEIKSSGDWQAWYPVLDGERCTACGQCADFCLFSVYEKQEGTVKVVNPQACKNNCPACARICPQTAIVFPKYQQGGAISGSDLFDAASEMLRQQQDVNAILGSDIYKALENRKLRRQSIIRTEAMKKALEEREKALKEKKENNPPNL